MATTRQYGFSNGATIKDIAQHCKVSTSTVSLALRDDSRVATLTKERILSTAATLGYRPDLAARRLVMKRYAPPNINRLIAISLPLQFYRARYFSDIFLGVLEVLDEERFDLLTMTHLGSDVPESERMAFFRSITQREVDGLIVFAPITDVEIVNQLRVHPGFGSRPIVSMAGSLTGYPAVTADFAAGQALAARHLLELGHRDLLCFMYDPNNWQAKPRYAGLRQAFLEAGLDPDKHLHPLRLPSGWGNPAHFRTGTSFDASSTDQLQAAAREQLLRFLHFHPDVTGILALNDANALHIWYTLQQAGLRVPEDISLIGFDDTDPMLDETGKNLLTSVKVPLIDIGRETAKLMVRLVTGEIPEEPAVMLPTELIVRHSTGKLNSAG